MYQKEVNEMIKCMRILGVRINTLKTIYNEIPLTPKGIPVPPSYSIMKKNIAETIIE